MQQRKIINSQSQFAEFADETPACALCLGHFNVIHPGHLRFLQHAKKHGEKLVIAMWSDDDLLRTAEPFYFSQNERAIGVAELSCVNKVIILDKISMEDVINALSPLTFVMGKEFESESRHFIEKYIDLVEAKAGKIIFHSGDIHYASESLFHGSVSSLQETIKESFIRICNKNDLHFKDFSKIITRYTDKKILVIGDSIVDQFVACEALGMSSEAPVVVLKEMEEQQFLGGAAIVAAHLNALGAKCSFLSVCGEDAAGDFIQSKLKESGVDVSVFYDKNRPTTYKIRYMVENQKMFRVTRLKDQSISVEIEQAIIKKLAELLPQMDGVIISDFVYGLITPKILTFITDLATKHKIKLFGDIQCSSQTGSVTKFKHFDLITPTERETRIALSDHDSGIEKLAHNLLRATDATNLLITLGANGFIAYQAKSRYTKAQHFPALCCNPVDVAGAGDSLLAVMALSLCAGATWLESAAISNCAAAITVNRIGNIPISARELRAYITQFTDKPLTDRCLAS